MARFYRWRSKYGGRDLWFEHIENVLKRGIEVMPAQSTVQRLAPPEKNIRGPRKCGKKESEDGVDQDRGTCPISCCMGWGKLSSRSKSAWHFRNWLLLIVWNTCSWQNGTITTSAAAIV